MTFSSTSSGATAATAPGMSNGLASLSVLGVAAVWGSTFLVVQDSTQSMPVLDFVAARFAVGTLVLAMLRPRAVRSLDRAGWVRGAVLGLALGVSYTLQSFGLQHTSATASAFVTGMFVVFTPLLSALVLRRRITLTTWAATGLAVVGLALLTLRGVSLGIGELLTLGCALCISLQILGTGAWATGQDPYGLAFAQMATVSVVAAAVAAPAGLNVVPPTPAAWFGVLWTGVLATAAALVIQTWAQTRLSTTRAAVIMTMEPVFAALFGLLAGQFLSVRQIIGCCLVLAAMFLVELHTQGKTKAGSTSPSPKPSPTPIVSSL